MFKVTHKTNGFGKVVWAGGRPTPKTCKNVSGPGKLSSNSTYPVRTLFRLLENCPRAHHLIGRSN